MRKITKQDRRELRKLASLLPPTFADATVHRAVWGFQLLEHDPEYKLPDGTKIDPKKRYTMKIDDKIMVNDARKLEKIYERFGIEAVKQYVDDVKALNAPPTHVGGLKLGRA